MSTCMKPQSLSVVYVSPDCCKNCSVADFMRMRGTSGCLVQLWMLKKRYRWMPIACTANQVSNFLPPTSGQRLKMSSSYQCTWGKSLRSTTDFRNSHKHVSLQYISTNPVAVKQILHRVPAYHHNTLPYSLNWKVSGQWNEGAAFLRHAFCDPSDPDATARMSHCGRIPPEQLVWGQLCLPNPLFVCFLQAWQCSSLWWCECPRALQADYWDPQGQQTLWWPPNLAESLQDFDAASQYTSPAKNVIR